jgi:hypothetical protein
MVALAVWLRDGLAGQPAQFGFELLWPSRQRKILFLVVGENISPRGMVQKLADLGAKDGDAS